MAVGNFTVLDVALTKIGSTINLASDAFKMALTTTTQTIDQTFTGASGHGYYSDLTNEVANGAGYSTGGVALTGQSWTTTSHTATFTTGNASWTLTGGGITFRYGVIYANTATNKDIIGYFDSVVGGGSQTPGAGSFTIQPGTGGWFTLTQTNPQA
jgi:hypothetical protein